ncbi:MAG TPA: phage/plasmid primase, P4 family [Bryobacteraceae bacterium]|nr:phage/plasmid primase, P4 family [Bryobacteraceae bacterium]
MPAEIVQARLTAIAAELGHKTAEIFPKQTRVDSGAGNWINMPYYGDSRHAIAADGSPLTLSQFLDLAESRAVSAEWFRNTESGTRAKKSGTRKPVNAKRFTIPDVIPSGARDSTLTSLAGAMRRNAMSVEAIHAALRETNAQKCVPPLPDADLERIAKSVGRYEPDAPDEGLTPELAKAIKNETHFARDAGGRLYVFADGVYKPDGRRHVERRVKALCEALGKTKSWNPELASRVEAWILTDAPDLWERPALDVLNVKNGLLDVRTRELRAHDPAHLSPVQIPVAYDPGARCPHIEKFVLDVFPADTLASPFEIVAWAMLPNLSIQKAVLLLGEGANGKSVYLNLLIQFLGQDNVSTLSLHRIESDKFSAARLVGKLCNLGMDLPTSELSSTSVFKSITGGDPIVGERKFESSFEFRPFARLIFSANVAPRSSDSTHGFFRRFVCIPFNRTFSELDPDHVPRAVLDARLSEARELSGLLNRALDALPVIQSGRFTESDSTRAALDEFRRTTDPLAVYLDQHTVERADAMIPKDELRRAYGVVCQENGRPIMPDTQFTAALKRLRPKVQVSQRRINGSRARVFVGLGFVTQDPESGDGLF